MRNTAPVRAFFAGSATGRGRRRLRAGRRRRRARADRPLRPRPRMEERDCGGALRRLPPAYYRRSASAPSHPIKENFPGRSFCALQRAPGEDLTTVTVFGGTGFLGQRLVQRLAAARQGPIWASLWPSYRAARDLLIAGSGATGFAAAVTAADGTRAGSASLRWMATGSIPRAYMAPRPTSYVGSGMPDASSPIRACGRCDSRQTLQAPPGAILGPPRRPRPPSR
jgi:hypothetical protein